MKIKVGDKVKFLNEEGGGIVSSVISPSLVNVTIEDGFDIPVLTSDLVVIPKTDDKTKASTIFDTNFDINEEDIVAAPQKVETAQNDFYQTTLSKYSHLPSVDQGVYLAFAPQNQQLLITGDVDMYLLNYTDRKIAFSLHRSTETEHVGIACGSIQAFSKGIIKTFNREELHHYLQGNAQVIFWAENTTEMMNPANANYRIKAGRFFKEDSYKANCIFNDRAIFAEICRANAQIEKKSIITPKFDAEKPVAKKAKIDVSDEFIKKHIVAKGKAVVDLHIGEIKFPFSHLSNSEILNLQTNYFIKALQSAMVAQITELVIIHGVGNGFLKAEVRNTLEQYDIEFRDAPIGEYGVGATIAEIPYNR